MGGRVTPLGERVGRTVVCGTARPVALVPPDVLGHLMHRVQL
jgi:hypothetical protein